MRDQRPSFSTTKSQQIITLAQHCWEKDPSTRPTFADIVTALEEGITPREISSVQGLGAELEKNNLDKTISSSSSSSSSSDFHDLESGHGVNQNNKSSRSHDNEKTSPSSKSKLMDRSIETKNINNKKNNNNNNNSLMKKGSLKDKQRANSTPRKRPSSSSSSSSVNGSTSRPHDPNDDYGNENTHFYQLRSEVNKTAVIGSAM